MAKTASPLRLLVVDPDDAARTLARRRFTRVGFEVMETAEPAKALSLISMIPFDLVLLDLATPDVEGGCGLELLRRMRESRGPTELPIIVVAEDAAGCEAVEALSLGADSCLSRPLDLDAVRARAEMLVGGQSVQQTLQIRLERLKDAVERAEAASAIHAGLGHELRAQLNGLIGAAAVLTKVCQTAELKRPIEVIETAVGALDLLMVQALGRTDRRTRAPKTSIRVLLADDDAGSRLAMRELLHATEIGVELIEAGTGLQAAVATETHFFDLILMSLATPEAIAGIRAIRRAERQNRTRRTPILAFGDRQTAAQTLDAGADLYMRQPVTADRLLSTLADAIGQESEDVSAVA
jgi:DNA-binding response OmpR family regulator